MDSEFCIFISGCRSNNLEHDRVRLKYLSQILSNPDKDGNSLTVETCCDDTSRKSYHKDHHLLISVPESLIRKCAATLCTHGSYLDPNSIYVTNLLKNSTHGQIARFADVALRMVNISDHDINYLNTVCKCGKSELCKEFKLKKPEVGRLGSLYEFENQGIITLSILGIISEPLIRHNKNLRRETWSESVKPISIYPSIPKIRNYLGDNVGFYFSWLKTYCLLLLLPGSASISSYFLTNLLKFFESYFTESDAENESLDVHGKPNTPLSYFRMLYGILVTLWALCCLKLWNRQKQHLEFVWTENSSLTNSSMQWMFSTLAVRPTFSGIWRVSPVTGKLELYFGASSRRLRYLITGSITVVCLSLAVLLNFMLMNLEGYIKLHRSPWIYFWCLSCWTETGEIFDPNGGGYLAYLPGIMHPILILIMNQMIFRSIAEKLTDFENHKTQEDYDRALIIKRFLFEAVDAYACLAYLGFVLVDWNALQSMLNTMFATDTVRRITCECILPGINYKLRSIKMDHKVKKQKKDDEAMGKDSVQHIKKELFGDLYEPFDDYLEMTLQHGYLVLFAMACPPFVAIAAFICTWVESFSDIFKLLWIIQRPVPQNLPRGHNVWMTLLTVQAWLGILSNVGLLAARGIISYPGVFILEHFLILVGLTVHFGIKNEPAHVRDLRRHKAYMEMKIDS